MTQLHDNIYAFIWESMTVNNCNTYLIDGPTRVLIDPGHEHLFEHVLKGLENLDLSIEDIGLVICTHAHPDHIEAVKLFKNTPALFSIHEEEWKLVKSMEKHINISLKADISSFSPDFFLKQGEFSINGLGWDVRICPAEAEKYLRKALNSYQNWKLNSYCQVMERLFPEVLKSRKILTM
ncbi:MAG: MBL fold metallo-hydrolase [Deltaproteobacteria bacterium]|nr:MBL fold metallo-hydrolase [Deltaproteobacteria bacterium]